MRAVWGPDPVAFEGRFYRIAPSEVNPKPVQERLPVLIGATTPAGIERAARIADGLNPIAFSPESLRGMVRGFRDAAAAAGRDPDTLTVAVRANVPMTVKPIDDGRPYLGGSPEQIANDVAGLVGHGVHQVMFANTVGRDLDEYLHLLGELHATVTDAVT